MGTTAHWCHFCEKLYCTAVKLECAITKAFRCRGHFNVTFLVQGRNILKTWQAQLTDHVALIFITACMHVYVYVLQKKAILCQYYNIGIETAEKTTLKRHSYSDTTRWCIMHGLYALWYSHTWISIRIPNVEPVWLSLRI